MEDILASIRRIIADDQVQASRPSPSGPRRLGGASAGAHPGPSSKTRDARGGQDDVFDLARLRSAEPEPVRAPSDAWKPVPAGGSVSAPTTPETGPVRITDELRQPMARPLEAEPHVLDEDEGVVDVASIHDDEPQGTWAGLPGQSELRPFDSHATSDASAEDEALISAKPGQAVLSAFETLAATVVLQNGEMLERIMRDELRPMIKTWLDDNLPTMVERLVRAEIERVARGPKS